MENKYGFDANDTFEERHQKVLKAMEDPEFREKVNTLVIIDFVTDGQREYKASDIEGLKEDLRQSFDEGIILEPGEIKDVLGQKLAKATNQFSQMGSYRFTGSLVCELVDYLATTCVENHIDHKYLGEMTEIVLAGALGIGFGLEYGEYQTDITISGQGLLPETYFMDIQFRPIPKNIASS